jgi:uncharacterized protein GlcG (DUF336 family)
VSDLVVLTILQANEVVEGAFKKAGELGLAPLSVAVLDAGADLIVFQRQDGSSNLRPQIAVAKASGSLALGVSSRKIAQWQRTGQLVGAVGVTGDNSDNDEACALAGIAGAGLWSEP